MILRLKKDLKLKYLTGMYAYMDGCDGDESNLFSLINEIKSSRRSKKNWNKSDFVFGNDIAKKQFGEKTDEILSSLAENGYVECNEGSYSVSEKGLLLFYEL